MDVSYIVVGEDRGDFPSVIRTGVCFVSPTGMKPFFSLTARCLTLCCFLNYAYEYNQLELRLWHVLG